MQYFKVVKDGYDYFNKYAVIENELLTVRERHTKARYLSDEYFKPVMVSQKKTFFNFGCRFEIKD